MWDVQGDLAPVTVELSGLTPGTVYTVNLHAGTCALPSASFARLGDITADAGGAGQLQASEGTASATGAQVILTTELVLDGDHILLVVGDDAVACGTIPSLAATSGPGPIATPSQLPATGGLPLGLLAALGLSSLALGWRLRRL
jgi:hypothetical protein